MSKRLGIYWPDLLVVMNMESGISPAARNPSGASGLIQIINLPAAGWTQGQAAYLALSDVQQLPSVEQYLRVYAPQNLNSIGRIHQALLGPATLRDGMGPDTVIYRRNGTRFGGAEGSYYAANSKFDTTGKGYFTVGDVEAYDLAHAGPGSPFDRAYARLKALLPEYSRRPGSTAVQPSQLAAALLGMVALGTGIWYFFTQRAR